MARKASERQAVEEYLRLHSIQECLDDVINDLVVKRPLNPYIAITKMMEMKASSTITDVHVHTSMGGRGGYSILATVVTNIDSFSASVAYPYNSMEIESPSDLTNVRDKLKSSLCLMDPTEVSNIDKILSNQGDLNDTVAMAVSMACCRAGARHKGLPLYQFLHEELGKGSTGDSASVPMRIPIPVVAVLSRARIDDGMLTKTITICHSTCL
jgi:enolase